MAMEVKMEMTGSLSHYKILLVTSHSIACPHQTKNQPGIQVSLAHSVDT
jgi:hypothetical protein